MHGAQLRSSPYLGHSLRSGAVVGGLCGGALCGAPQGGAAGSHGHVHALHRGGRPLPSARETSGSIRIPRHCRCYGSGVSLGGARGASGHRCFSFGGVGYAGRRVCRLRRCYLAVNPANSGGKIHRYAHQTTFMNSLLHDMTCACCALHDVVVSWRHSRTEQMPCTLRLEYNTSQLTKCSLLFHFYAVLLLPVNQPITHSLTEPLSRSLIHPLTHLITHSVSQSLT